MQTDDTIIICNNQFATLEQDELEKAKFTAKPREKLTLDNPLMFNRCVLTIETDGSMYLKQKGQGKNLALLDTKADFRYKYT